MTYWLLLLSIILLAAMDRLPRSANAASGGPESGTVTFYSEMDEHALRQFKTALAGIDLGANREDVVRLLGPPASDAVEYPKGRNTPARARILVYYVGSS
jgi:hypothetical protein